MKTVRAVEGKKNGKEITYNYHTKKKREFKLTYDVKIGRNEENVLQLNHHLKPITVQNISYALNFHMLGTSHLSYAWNFRTAADRCGFSDLLWIFRMHFIFVR